jgi:hypothetical protein
MDSERIAKRARITQRLVIAFRLIFQMGSERSERIAKRERIIQKLVIASRLIFQCWLGVYMITEAQEPMRGNYLISGPALRGLFGAIGVIGCVGSIVFAAIFAKIAIMAGRQKT